MTVLVMMDVHRSTQILLRNQMHLFTAKASLINIINPFRQYLTFSVLGYAYMSVALFSLTSHWFEGHAHPHLLILFSPMSTNQKIATAKLSASILRKNGKVE